MKNWCFTAKIMAVIFFGGMLMACGSKKSYIHPSVASKDILPQGDTLSEEYGYLYLTHDKVLGNPTLSYWVMDNCRYAGTFYSETFLLVKLVPGKHVVRIYCPAESFTNKNINGNFDSIELDIIGGEILIYEPNVTWTSGMKFKKADIDILEGMSVSKGCSDCVKDPNPQKSLDWECFQ